MIFANSFNKIIKNAEIKNLISAFFLLDLFWN